MRVHKFWHRWSNLLALFIVGLFVVAAAAAPWIAPLEGELDYDTSISTGASSLLPQPPGPGAPLGTLPNRVDVFTSLVWGARSAITFGLQVVLITMLIGSLLGALSAYQGGWLNDLGMRVTDAFLAFPLIAGVAFMQQWLMLVRNAEGLIPLWMLGPLPAGDDLSLYQRALQAIDPILLAFILFSWMPYARLVNAQALRVKRSEYIEAARALGAGRRRIILRHLLPNSISPVIVLAARDLGSVVVLQATFTFIRIGGGSVWGEMLSEGRNWIIGAGGNIFQHWWVFVPATLALVLYGVGWNMLGDGLNDYLNPRG